MDIKNLHEIIEKLVSCTKAELDKKGIEEVDTKELGEVADIIKDLSEAQYYRTLVVAMETADFGWDYDEEGPLEEGRRGYRGQPRSKSSGRYMSRGDGRRRGYEDKMPMYDEWMRDMDRYDHGRMYYTDVGSGMSGGNSSMNSGSTTGNSGSTRGYMDNHGGQYSSRMQRDEREGRSGEARRGYMETKEMHKGNTAEEKQKKMKELEHYMNELSSDLTEMIADASPEEKNMLKTKLTTLSTKIS